MNKLLKKKGFTLIEILIVVVIIGILASLILPKMLSQPERAITAEAMQYFGVIARAFEASSSPGQTVFTAASSGDPGGTANSSWKSLGLDNLPGGSHFRYDCTAPVADNPATPLVDETVLPTCTATRKTPVGGTAGPKDGGTITMNMNIRQITACDQTKYVLANAGTDKATCV